MPQKVFELAKELDFRPLDLVEELRSKGYDVRNHMSSLSDEEVEKIVAEFKRAEEEKEAQAKVVKKKTRKKATKKAARKKTSKAGEKKSTTKKASTKEDKPKKSTKAAKKRVVIRRRGSEVGEEKESASASSSAASSEQEKGEEGKDTSGLRVVSAPEKKPAPKKYTQEPRYRDPVPSTPDDGDRGKEGKESKKRLSGLASMLNRRAVNRSQMLQETRADAELKAYTNLSGVSRPIYTTVKRKKQHSGPSRETEITSVREAKRVIKLHDYILAVDLARKLKIKFRELMNRCLEINLLLKQDDCLGVQLAGEIAALYDYRVENVAFQEEKILGKKELSEEEVEQLPLRAPIITVMGHVDHGKTSLLDRIRSAKVADGESGGITQHIGAYSVQTAGEKTLTFLDTPGHSAFSSMRERGANITDIVILVVAADDGVMPQTRESIQHIQNAGVPMIVAINKIDKEDANPEKIKQELTEFNITPEEWGGDVQMIPVSALRGDGIDALLEAAALQAEIMQLRADPKVSAEGVVVESHIEVGRGAVATIVVQEGTLNKGSTIVVGETYGRARSLTDHSGAELKSAGPAVPVQVLGLNQTPSPGDIMNVVKNEREAKRIADYRGEERKKLAEKEDKKISLEDFFASAPSDGQESKTLNVIVRADVQGSYEAIVQSLEPLSTREADIKVIGGGVGPINDNDVSLAESAGAVIFGFNMRPATSARRLAEQKKIDVKTYSIIYELINDVTLALEGMLDPDKVEKYIGRAEVKETFSVPKAGVIAGSAVIDGVMKVGCQIRLLREGKIMFDGTMSSLRRFKDDVKEVKNGLECGIGLENYNDVKAGDIFEAYIMEDKKRSLDDVRLKEKQEDQAKEEAALQEENEEAQESLDNAPTDDSETVSTP